MTAPAVRHAVARAWRQTRAQWSGAPERAARRCYAKGYGWVATATGQLALFERPRGRRRLARGRGRADSVG